MIYQWVKSYMHFCIANMTEKWTGNQSLEKIPLRWSRNILPFLTIILSSLKRLQGILLFDVNCIQQTDHLLLFRCSGFKIISGHIHTAIYNHSCSPDWKVDRKLFYFCELCFNSWSKVKKKIWKGICYCFLRESLTSWRNCC